jgi:hypothetical protein
MAHFLCNLIGHNYQGRYDSEAASPEVINRIMKEVGPFLEDVVAAAMIADAGKKTYVADVCPRCGSVTHTRAIF